MAKKKDSSVNYKYICIFLVIVLLVLLSILEKSHKSNEELTKETQAFKSYLFETTGLVERHPLDTLQTKIVTDQNKIYINKFLGISYEMPLGWYFDEQSSLTSNIFGQPNQTGGFMILYNMPDKERAYSELLQNGEYAIQLSVGLRKEDISEYNVENVVIDGKQAKKVVGELTGEGTDKIKRKFFTQTYYVTHRTLHFSLEATTLAESNPDFKEFTQLIQSIKFE